jgi:hypothetical protein
LFHKVIPLFFSVEFTAIFNQKPRNHVSPHGHCNQVERNCTFKPVVVNTSAVTPLRYAETQNFKHGNITVVSKQTRLATRTITPFEARYPTG